MIVEKETVEQFLARGGVIQKLPYKGARKEGRVFMIQGQKHGVFNQGLKKTYRRREAAARFA